MRLLTAWWHDRASSTVKGEVGQFLEAAGYIVAPVTIDSSEWMYAYAYDIALDRHDVALASRIAGLYIRYMSPVFDCYERLLRDLFQREPAQILLIHANRLHADYIDALTHMIRERGYSFISLQEALSDPAYLSTDT
jgi:hypothetical protein